jgi:hypothetical protein
MGRGDERVVPNRFGSVGFALGLARADLEGEAVLLSAEGDGGAGRGNGNTCVERQKSKKERLGKRSHRFSSGVGGAIADLRETGRPTRQTGRNRAVGAIADLRGTGRQGSTASRRRFACATNTACTVWCIQRNSIFLIIRLVEQIDESLKIRRHKVHHHFFIAVFIYNAVVVIHQNDVRLGCRGIVPVIEANLVAIGRLSNSHYTFIPVNAEILRVLYFLNTSLPITIKCNISYIFFPVDIFEVEARFSRHQAIVRAQKLFITFRETITDPAFESLDNGNIYASIIQVHI